MAKVKIKKHKKIIFSVVVLLVSALAFFLYAEVRQGGFFRAIPPIFSEVYVEAEHPVFVYGTLRFSVVRHLVFGGSGQPEPAVLEGFTRRGLDLEEDGQARVDGLLLQVNPAELAALDRYERLGVRYRRQLVTLADGTEAWVYRRM